VGRTAVVETCEQREDPNAVGRWMEQVAGDGRRSDADGISLESEV